MKAIRIGEKIYSLLSELNVTTYPIVADVTTEFPFIVYKREDMISNGTKDDKMLNPTISIVIASTTYEESIEISEQVLDLLIDYSDEDIYDIRLISSDEQFADNTFIQSFNFNIILQ